MNARASTRDTSNKQDTEQRQTTRKTTQKTKKMSNTDLNKKTFIYVQFVHSYA